MFHYANIFSSSEPLTVVHIDTMIRPADQILHRSPSERTLDEFENAGSVRSTASTGASGTLSEDSLRCTTDGRASLGSRYSDIDDLTDEPRLLNAEQLRLVTDKSPRCMNRNFYRGNGTRDTLTALTRISTINHLNTDEYVTAFRTTIEQLRHHTLSILPSPNR